MKFGKHPATTVRSGGAAIRRASGFSCWLASVLAVAGLATGPAAWAAVPVLRGFVVEGKDVRLLLCDAESKHERWVAVGGHFGNYNVQAWLAERQSAMLSGEGRTLILSCTDGRVSLASSAAEAYETEGIVENVRKLTVSACQYFLEQDVASVSTADLVGADKMLNRLEPAAGENYQDILFSVGDDGLRMIVDGRSEAVLKATGPLAIQVAPTQSLSGISQRLRIPLDELRRLNPQLAGEDRISEWALVRLR